MKKLTEIISLVLILTAIWPSGNAFGQSGSEGLAILFDNSGSMRQFFTQQQLEDAKQLVEDLLFRGTFDDELWELSAENDSVDALWAPGKLIYVHAFGELDSPTDPFFKNSPEHSTDETQIAARRYVRQSLLDRLDFQDDFTFIDLAKQLCWWNIASTKGPDGRGFEMDVLVVTDGIADARGKYIGAGTDIVRQITRSRVREERLMLFTHRRGPTSGSAELQLQVLRIGPHFIRPREDVVDSTVSGDYVRLTSPEPMARFSSVDKMIQFSWESEGDFEKFVLEIRQVAPAKSVFAKVVQGRRTYPVNIDQYILKKLGGVDERGVVLAADIRGVYASGTERSPVRSKSVKFRIQGEQTDKSGNIGIWLGIGGVVLLGGFYWLYTSGALRRFTDGVIGAFRRFRK